MAMATKALRLLEYISHCILRIVLILIARKMQEGHACWALSLLDNAGHFQCLAMADIQKYSKYRPSLKSALFT